MCVCIYFPDSFIIIFLYFYLFFSVFLFPPHPTTTPDTPKRGVYTRYRFNKGFTTGFFTNAYRVRFTKKTWSRLNFDVLGPENSDSSSKTTHIVLLPGLNSPIQVQTPQTICLRIFSTTFGLNI